MACVTIILCVVSHCIDAENNSSVMVYLSVMTQNWFLQSLFTAHHQVNYIK